MKNKKCIYNPQLAGFLMFHKIKLQRIERNLGRPWVNVYLFEDDGNIEKLIDEYKKIKENDYDINGICRSDHKS